MSSGQIDVSKEKNLLVWGLGNGTGAKSSHRKNICRLKCVMDVSHIQDKSSQNPERSRWKAESTFPGRRQDPETPSAQSSQRISK